jgi:OOP family OmpA-OmpF porin
MDDRRDERPRTRNGGVPKAERSELTPRPPAIFGVGALGVALMGAMGCTERLPPNPVPRSAGPQEIPGWFDPNARWDPKGTDTRIYIEGKIVYDTDKATIRPESERVLLALLAFLNQRPDVTRVRIEGHTDSRASNEYNQDLSARRSLSVCNWLVDHGIDHLRLIAVGFGEERPIGPNQTAPGRQENRRTEFHVAEVNGRPWGGKDETNGGLALEVLSAEERAKLNQKPPPPPKARPFVPEGDVVKPAKPPVEKEVVPGDQVAPSTEPPK